MKTSFLLLLVLAVGLICLATYVQSTLNQFKRGWTAVGEDFGNIETVGSGVDEEGNIYSAVNVSPEKATFGDNCIVNKPPDTDIVFALVKYASDGTCLWVKTANITGTTAYSTSVALYVHSGSIYLFVASYNGDIMIENEMFSGTQNQMVMKYTSDGSLVWIHSHTTGSISFLHSQIVNNDSLIYSMRIVGDLDTDSTLAYNTKYTESTVVIRVGFDGIIKWTKGVDYKKNINWLTNSFKASSDTYYIFSRFSDPQGASTRLEINGVSQSTMFPTGSEANIFIVGFAINNGTTKFTNVPKLTSVRQVKLEVYQNDVYLLGAFEGDKLKVGSTEYLNSKSGTQDIFLIKYSSDGTITYAKVFGGTAEEAISGFSVNQKGVFIVFSSESTFTFEGTSVTAQTQDTTNYLMVKYKLDGTFVIVHNFTGKSSDDKEILTPVSDDGFLLKIANLNTVSLKKITEAGQLGWEFNASGTQYIKLITESAAGDYIYLTMEFKKSLDITGLNTITVTDYGVTFVTLNASNGKAFAMSDLITAKQDVTIGSQVLHNNELVFVATTFQKNELLLGTVPMITNTQSTFLLFGIVSDKTYLCNKRVENCEECSDYDTCTACVTPLRLVGGMCRLTNCYGVNWTDVNVCSGRGQCTDTDKCCCPHGWAGHICTREKHDDPYYYNQCWV
jgi:hypothetical protein